MLPTSCISPDGIKIGRLRYACRGYSLDNNRHHVIEFLNFERFFRMTDFRHETDNIPDAWLLIAAVLGGDASANLSKGKNQWLQCPWRRSFYLQEDVYSCLRQARCLLQLCKTPVKSIFILNPRPDLRFSKAALHSIKPRVNVLTILYITFVDSTNGVYS